MIGTENPNNAEIPTAIPESAGSTFTLISLPSSIYVSGMLVLMRTRKDPS